MPILGSSPLGLTSSSRQDNAYSVGNYKVVLKDDVAGYQSLFKNTIFSPYSGDTNPITGREINESSKEIIHNRDIYDTKISSIVDYTSKYPAMVLLPSDFAFCKNVGVYPNNRLIVARRFASPVGDDLTRMKMSDNVAPLATLVSWVGDGDDFINLSFGEEWEEVADGNFTKVLNQIGNELVTPGIGTIAEQGLRLVPLPGVMEGLQYKVMERMGISAGQIPMGNPNLIKKAMMRKVVENGTSGSGLKASFEVKMVVEYEQKYIEGIDPTLVYYDIIANALAFGTSDSYFQFNGKFNSGVNNFIQDLQSGNVRGVIEAVKLFVGAVADGIKDVAKTLINSFVSKYKQTKEALEKLGKLDAGGYSKAIGDGLMGFFNTITKETVGAVIGKYKIKIIGILNAMTGSNSTPWHVTIGNPKKPTFSSGDMITTDVKLTLGPTLSFNDLPSSIKIEFTLKNARPLGAQEIYNKFNNGSGREYKRLNLSIYETTKYVVKKDAKEGEAAFTEVDDESAYKTTFRRDDQEDTSNKTTTEVKNDTTQKVVEEKQITPEPEPEDDDIIDGGELEEIVIEIDRGEYYYSFRIKTATVPDIMSGTAPTLQEAEELIELFAAGDVVLEKEIYKIKIPKENGTNES